ncbi:alpha/beta hydrolase [Hoeflea sp. WL0058]|uniref:Alpha/beta hydrolase n=1 Tax=Flavimaribacter sediminis TaxID=2865987 RepID=A0AAE3D0F7_9HYPH|nr:alpha/beta hydrolase [Flavimaribacter sediminis]MBW8638465.1 alpha/beta hydrolase [Flavimaribacter sediminis]
MLSDNDLAFYAAVGPKMAALQANLFHDTTMAENAQRYRAMIESLDEFKHSPESPSVHALHEGVQITPEITADIAIPHGKGPFPVILHVHGNAFIGGDPASFRRTTLDFAHAGFVTVMPDYRLAPEHPFPAAFDDMIAAAEWLAQGIGEYRGDPGRMLITGNSSGAGLAFAVVRALREYTGHHAFRAVAGFDGHYDRAAEPKSWLQNAYLGAQVEKLLADPRVSPNVGLERHMLPPCLLTTGAGDFACPNTLDFAQTLTKTGVRYELHVFEGARHDAMRYPHLDVSRRILDTFFSFAREVLNTPAETEK